MNILILSLGMDLSAIDEKALIISIVGYMIVFCALAALYFVFYLAPKILKIKWNRKEGNGNQPNQEEELTGEISAAISMALYLHFNQYHDEESRNLTIKRESRLYSPWSSKIYQVRNQFNRS